MWEDSTSIRGVLALGGLPLDLRSDACKADLEDQEVAEFGAGEEPVGGAGDLGRGGEVVEAVGGVEGREREDAVGGAEGAGGGDELVDKLRGGSWGE